MLLRKILPIRLKAESLVTYALPLPLSFLFAIITIFIGRHSSVRVETSAEYLNTLGGFWILFFALFFGSAGSNLLSSNLFDPISRRTRLKRSIAAYQAIWGMSLAWVIFGSIGFQLAEACFAIGSLNHGAQMLAAVTAVDGALFPVLLWCRLIMGPTTALARLVTLLFVPGLIGCSVGFHLSIPEMIGLCLILGVAFHLLCLHRLKRYFLWGDLLPSQPLVWRR